MSSDLDNLEERLKKARAVHERGNADKKYDAKKVDNSGLAIAMWMSVEMISAIAVACLIGFYLDKWLDTSPFLLIIFFFLGCAAGFTNIIRSAKGYSMSAGYNKIDDTAIGGENNTDPLGENDTDPLGEK